MLKQKYSKTSIFQEKRILENVEEGQVVENVNVEMIKDVKEEHNWKEFDQDDSKKHAEDLNAEIISKMERVKEGFLCKVCGKLDTSSKDGSNMRNHIESLHVTGFTHTCNECGMTKASRNALRLHRYKMHKRV